MTLTTLLWAWFAETGALLNLGFLYKDLNVIISFHYWILFSRIELEKEKNSIMHTILSIAYFNNTIETKLLWFKQETLFNKIFNRQFESESHQISKMG